MRISTFGYSMKQGVKNIGRNKMFSIASIATMSACIFLFGLFYSIVMNFNYIVDKAEQGVAITVFFNEDATQEQKDKIGEDLKKEDGVLEVNYISAEEAWNKFQDDYFGDSKEAAEGFKIIHWQIQTTMKYTCQMYPSRNRSYLMQRNWTVYGKSTSQIR